MCESCGEKKVGAVGEVAGIYTQGTALGGTSYSEVAVLEMSWFTLNC